MTVGGTLNIFMAGNGGPQMTGQGAFAALAPSREAAIRHGSAVIKRSSNGKTVWTYSLSKIAPGDTPEALVERMRVDLEELSWAEFRAKWHVPD